MTEQPNLFVEKKTTGELKNVKKIQFGLNGDFLAIYGDK